MSYLLADPTVVVTVGGSAADRDRVDTAVTAGTATDTVGLDAVDAIGPTLEARDDVGCVVALDVDEVGFGELCDAARTVSDHLPVVVHADADDEVATAVAGRASGRFLPRTASEDALRETVDDALETYEERRQAAADSSFFTTLLEEGKLTIFAKDEEGRFLRMADVPYTPDPDEAVGKTDVVVFSEDDAEMAKEAHEDDLRVVETGEPIRNKLEQYGQRGGDYWSEVTKIPWREDGEVRGLVGYSLDITERVQCKQKLEKQRRRFDQFASYVSHDLRTPLQVSIGSLKQAREGHEEAFERIERSNERIEEIIEDLSALAKGDRSDVALSEQVLDALDVGVESTELRPLVERVWRVNETEHATLDLAVPDGTEVIAEGETLRPVIENLLKNALDHAGPDVTVRVGTVGRGFYVEDDGPGIPDSERDRILEDGYTTADDGTGTGLSIVADTVDQQGWNLHITDGERRTGARFEVTGCPVVVPYDAAPGATVDITESQDVGDVSLEGDATYDPGRDRWTVVGNGRDIWRGIDEFHFTHGEASNPVRIEGRLVDVDGVHEYSKAGLMVRNGTGDDAAFGFVGATENHGTETLWRERAGADAASDQFEEPYGAYQWYRIDVVGGEVTLSFSTDGDEWQVLDQRPIDLGDTLAVGLAVCSHSEDEVIEAVFEDVSVTELDVE